MADGLAEQEELEQEAEAFLLDTDDQRGDLVDKLRAALKRQNGKLRQAFEDGAAKGRDDPRPRAGVGTRWHPGAAQRLAVWVGRPSGPRGVGRAGGAAATFQTYSSFSMITPK
jgi:hypothetical protein